MHDLKNKRCNQMTSKNTILFIKRICISCSLIVFFSANAEWVKYHENDKAIYYLDPTTAVKDKNFIKIWELQDLKKPNDRGNISIRFRQEYDCHKESFRILSLSEHIQPMALGELFNEFNGVTTWFDIPPSTNAQRVFKIVCLK